MKTSPPVVRFADSVQFSDGSGTAVYYALDPAHGGAQGGSSEDAARSARSRRREEVVEMRKTLQDLEKNFNNVNGEVIQLRKEVAGYKEELRGLSAKCCQGRCAPRAGNQHVSKCDNSQAPAASATNAKPRAPIVTGKPVKSHTTSATEKSTKPTVSQAINKPTASTHSHNKRVNFAAAQAGIQPEWRVPFARRQNTAPASTAGTVGSPPRTDPDAHFNATSQHPQHCMPEQRCTWCPEERRGDIDPTSFPSWLADELSPGHDIQDIEEAVDYHYQALGWSTILPRLREAQSPQLLEAAIEYITYARLWQARINGVHNSEGGFRYAREAYDY